MHFEMFDRNARSDFAFDSVFSSTANYPQLLNTFNKQLCRLFVMVRRCVCRWYVGCIISNLQANM